MDCSVVALRQKGLYMVSTVDFFYPSVDDPFYQGQIGAANVLSDLYAFGISECDNMLMIMGLSREMGEKERYIVSREMIRGFNYLAEKAGTEVTGGQTVMNPWPIIGGVAMSVVSEGEFVMPVKAIPGDVLVLTKPLGTQLAVNAHQWIKTNNEEKVKLLKEGGVKEEDVTEAYHHAMLSMARLNRSAAKLMLKYSAHAATDVTGFGILGHASNLASNQDAPLDFLIHSLPSIRHTPSFAQLAPGYRFQLGLSAETSGGLLICLPAEAAQPFLDELSSLDHGWPAFIVGDVTPRSLNPLSNSASLSPNLLIFDVDAP